MKAALEIGYLGIEVPDPTSLRGFLGDVIGLVPGTPVDGAMSWRNDDRAYRIVVQSGTANDAVFLGFEAVDDAAYTMVTRRLADAGFPISDGEPADLEARGVERLARVMAPWGVPVEIVLGLPRAAEQFVAPLMPGGFLTDGVGFGHAVFATAAYDESHDFLVRGLGMEQSDWLEIEIAPDIELEVRFYHCNERHHTIALAKAPFDLPQKLHHFMLETNSRDDVGAAFNRVWATDLAIANGLGKHDNDGMFSFYVTSPAGFQVEVGYGARVITDDWDDNRRYDRISAWGHQPLTRS